ncbi:MAG: phosphotransferase [Cyanobacteriota bacterium]|nr:phosphotransferase [Cyanobacteriota bacterium]
MNEDWFPVTYSTLDSSALANRLLPQYGIWEVASCQFWNRGLSDVYVVETSTHRYILRVSHHHWRSQGDIEFELELLDFLQQHHLPIASPLRTTDGQLFITIAAPEGKRYAALFMYAPGEVALGDLNPGQSWLMGETLAKIHQTALNFSTCADRQPLDSDYLLGRSLRTIAPLLKHRPKDLDYLKEAIANIEMHLADFPKKPPFWSICWGDPHSGNAHFTPDGQIALFDFDQCGYGWRAFDLGKFLQVALRGGVPKTAREAFFSGYQSVQVLTEWEWNALQLFTQMAHIWVWAISIDTAVVHNWCRLDEHYFTQRLEQLKRLTSRDWQLF